MGIISFSDEYYLLSIKEREQLVSNLSESLLFADDELKLKIIRIFKDINNELGEALEEKII